MDITKLKKDGELAEHGIWVEYEGARFKICSTDSKRYRRMISKIAGQRNPNRLRKDAEAMHEVTIEGLSEGILLEWENVNENGQPLEFTKANRLKVLAIEEVRQFIATEAQDLANFQREAVAEDAADLKSGD